MSRRTMFANALVILTACGVTRGGWVSAAPTEIKVPEDLPTERFDFEGKGIEGWTTVAGQWTVEDMAGASPTFTISTRADLRGRPCRRGISRVWSS